MHSHDVRALAIWPPYTPLSHLHQRQFPIDLAPILASAGLDMSVVLTPAAIPTSTIVKVTNPLNTSTEVTFEDAYHRKLAYVVRGAVRVARGARLVSCVREAGLTVWRIQNKPEEKYEGERDDEDVDMSGAIPEPLAGGWDKVLEMEFVVHSNIIAHEISDDGKWLVVSDMYETKLFMLRKNVSFSCLDFLYFNIRPAGRRPDQSQTDKRFLFHPTSPCSHLVFPFLTSRRLSVPVHTGLFQINHVHGCTFLHLSDRSNRRETLRVASVRSSPDPRLNSAQ